MNLVDWILNLAAVLLWLSWRSSGFAQRVGTPLALLGTLRTAEPKPAGRWPLPVGLLTLALVRGALYWQIGSAVDWMPQLNLGPIALCFPSDRFGLMLLFSLLGFLRVLSAFYLWLLLLSLANRRVADTDPLQRLVRLHLGWFERFPSFGKVILPPLAIALVWLALAPVLSRLQLLPASPTVAATFPRGLVIGLSALLSWKFLIVGLLLLHLLTSYVYVGTSPFWSFVEITGQNLLVPLRWLPLRLGRMDFAPAVGVVLVLVLAEFSARGLARLYQQPL